MKSVAIKLKWIETNANDVHQLMISQIHGFIPILAVEKCILYRCKQDVRHFTKSI